MTEEAVPTVDTSIEFTLGQLNSNNYQTVHDTVIKIRNLIIGNSKYKTFFMKDPVINRLASLVVEHCQEKNSSDLVNQIVIIFASFSLGNLDSIIRLINGHQLHKLIFNLIKLNVSETSTTQNKLSLKLIESALRCIANLYTTCQLVPSLIYTMDKQLYSCVDDQNELTCLDLLLKVYPISNLTKKTVIQVVSISSTLLTTLLASSNRFVNEPISPSNRRSIRMCKLNEQIKQNRSILIKSDCINKFAHLLTSLQKQVQLSVLKFYASISFESIEAMDLLLTCNYYECTLIDLIGAYLSRENCAELQLYAAKCLTNLCRTVQILTNSRKLNDMVKLRMSCSSRSKMSRSSKFKKLVKTRIDECASQVKFEEADFDNEADYEEEDTNGDDNHGDEDVDEYELNEESEIELDENDIEFESKTPPTADEISMLNEEYCRLTDPEAIAAAKMESLYKTIDTSSTLIQRRVLPTLVRLCSNFSSSYRNSNMKGSNLADLATSASANVYFTSLKSIADHQTKETSSHMYLMNVYLLIQSINTLTYLIELSAELQEVASFLEQIVPTLACNIVEAYALQNLRRVKLGKENQVGQSQGSYKVDPMPRKDSYRPMVGIDDVAVCVAVGDNTCAADVSRVVADDAGEQPKCENAAKLNTETGKEFASLYSMFYLNYNQYTVKAAQFKGHEHQYYQLGAVAAEILKGEHSQEFNETPKSSSEVVKMLARVHRFLSMLDKTVHKRLASSCFHALGALASNNEDTRRQITENSSLVCRLVDSIQLADQSSSEESHESDQATASDDNQEAESESESAAKYAELEEAFRRAEETGNVEDIESLLTSMKTEISSEGPGLVTSECDNDCDVDFINELDEEFDDYNQTDADMLRLSALCLLHSLSRSVHQLRTKFLDKKIWMPIIDLIKRSRKKRLEKRLLVLKFKRLRLLQMEQEKRQKLEENRIKLTESTLTSTTTTPIDMNVDEDGSVELKNRTTTAKKTSEGDDVDEMDFQDYEDEIFYEAESFNEQNLLAVNTAILANLLLEFSPSKEIMEENGIIKILVELVDHKNHSIRVNCMWTLMNTAFQADKVIKEQIISTITMDKLFQLLIEQDDTLVMKTLGLIRNLITNRVHIDQIMAGHGTKIIQAIIMILEGEYNLAIKEQALCILANVADGHTAKEFIVGNEDLLRKINSFMTYNSVELQIASVAVVSNLVWSTDDGAIERQSKLKEMGVHRVLQRLLQHNDPLLFEKVKNTLQQFVMPNNVQQQHISTVAQN